MCSTATKQWTTKKTEATVGYFNTTNKMSMETEVFCSHEDCFELIKCSDLYACVWYIHYCHYIYLSVTSQQQLVSYFVEISITSSRGPHTWNTAHVFLCFVLLYCEHYYCHIWGSTANTTWHVSFYKYMMFKILLLYTENLDFVKLIKNRAYAKETELLFLQFKFPLQRN